MVRPATGREGARPHIREYLLCVTADDPLPAPISALFVCLAAAAIAALLPALVAPAHAQDGGLEAASAGASESEADTDADPWAALVAIDAPLAEAVLRHTDEESAADVAIVLLAADERLRTLLLPASPAGPLPDRQGEDIRVDLYNADFRLVGTHLVGTAQGVGVVENGVWLDLDVRGGPAADLRLGFGQGWSREATLDDAGPSPFLAREVLPDMGEDSLSIDLDLSGSARFDPAHAGSVVAVVKSFDGTVEDVGPGGLLGVQPEDALDVLDALVTAGNITDPDLAVALAVGFGAIRAKVADDVVSLVDADAVAWLAYGQSLDAFLEASGATWRFSDRDAFAKLVWAWPAAQTIAYGTFAIAGEQETLTAARYRFLVPGAAELAALRDRAPMHPSAALTADFVDAQLWKSLAYRTNDDLMRTLCSAGEIEKATCKAWNTERMKGVDLGVVDGEHVLPSEGVSASLQLKLREERGQFIGDCAMETSLAIWTLQSVGIPAIGMGWAGTDLATPTHDVPLWLDGDTFRATQAGPGRDWAAESAFVYVTIPGVHPVNAFSLAREPNGWSRGGAVAGGWTKFAEVRSILSRGLPASVVGGWVDTQALGGWPTW